MNQINVNIDPPDSLSVPPTPNDSLDSGYTAIPHGFGSAGEAGTDLDLVVDATEYGEMNEADAIESGYIDGAKADFTPDISQPVFDTEDVVRRAVPGQLPSMWREGVVLGAVALLSWGVIRYFGRSRGAHSRS